MADTIVDFIPKISSTGDFKKITDYSILTANNKVSTLMNFLEMIRGRNSVFPEFGGYQELLKIPYSEDADAVSARISNAISTQLTFQVKVDYELNSDGDMISLTLTVEGLPQNIKMDVERNRKHLRFVNPRLV